MTWAQRLAEEHGFEIESQANELDLLRAEVERLREQNRRLEQKVRRLSNRKLSDADLQKISDTYEALPGGWITDIDDSCLNLIGKATLRNSLTLCVRHRDASGFSAAKSTVRRLLQEIQRLRNEVQK